MLQHQLEQPNSQSRHWPQSQTHNIGNYSRQFVYDYDTKPELKPNVDMINAENNALENSHHNYNSYYMNTPSHMNDSLLLEGLTQHNDLEQLLVNSSHLSPEQQNHMIPNQSPHYEGQTNKLGLNESHSQHNHNSCDNKFSSELIAALAETREIL